MDNANRAKIDDVITAARQSEPAAQHDGAGQRREHERHRHDVAGLGGGGVAALPQLAAGGQRVTPDGHRHQDDQEGHALLQADLGQPGDVGLQVEQLGLQHADAEAGGRDHAGTT